MVSVLISLSFVLAAGTVLLTVPPLIRTALKRRWMDRPDGGRKLHDRAVPSIGGITIAAGIAIGISVLWMAAAYFPFSVNMPPPVYWAVAAGIVGIGLLDDLWGISFKAKFLAQLVAAYLLLHAGFVIDASALLPFIGEDPFQRALIDIPVTLLWIVGVINAVNLLDGLDGLAAGVALIAFASMGTVFALQGHAGPALLALVVVGALTGFLWYNANPATIFMGDSGSLLLGFLLATYPLHAPAHADPIIAFFVPVVALGLPVMDTGVSMYRRFIRRKSVFRPDRDHIHHRLERNYDHQSAVHQLYLVSGLFGIGAVLLVTLAPHRYLMILTIIISAAYLWLRTLGYMRVRASLRAVHRHYGIDLTGARLEMPAETEPPIQTAPRKGAATQTNGTTTHTNGTNGANGTHTTSRQDEREPEPARA